MKKRFYGIILLLLVVFMLSACGTDTINTSELAELQESVVTDLVSTENDTDIQEEVTVEPSENADVESNITAEENETTPSASVVPVVPQEEEEQQEKQEQAVEQEELQEEQEEELQEEPKEATHSYVANRNTGKLHYVGCSSVDKMRESNKVYLDCTRSEALARGYEPCKRCNP